MVDIEVMGDGNIAELARLFGQYREFYSATADYPSDVAFLEQFLDQEKGVFFVAKCDGDYVGYVSLYFSYSSVSAKQIAILNDLYVREKFRGRGIGRALMNHAITESKAMGVSQVRWCTRIDNDQAQGLYVKYSEAKKTDWYHYDLGV